MRGGCSTTDKNEKIYDAALTYKCVGTTVGTIVGTRCVFWCFMAFFYEYLRAEKGGKYKKNQPTFNVLALNIG